MWNRVLIQIALAALALTATAATPTVQTGRAIGVSNSVATLVATVNPNGSASTAWFEWGLRAGAYDNQTAPVALGAGGAPVTFSNSCGGLISGLNYHFRAVATNTSGLVKGGDRIFGSPLVTLNGLATITNECHTLFSDAGATAAQSPVSFVAGGFHAIALRADGTPLAWGAGLTNGAISGPIGIDYGQVNTSGDLSNLLAVAAGYQHSLAVQGNGTVTAWGLNNFNQLNPPASATNVTALAAGYGHGLALRGDGSVVAWGNNDSGQSDIPSGLNGVSIIAAGYFHNLALQSNGTLVAWGENADGETSVPPNATNLATVVAGGYHSLALRRDGSVIGWGYNDFGQVNIPASVTNVVAIAAGGYHNLALRADGIVIAWGDASGGAINVPANATNIVAIAAGEAFSLAQRADGTIIGWGLNNYGQRTVPTTVSTLTVSINGNVNTNSPALYSLDYTATNLIGGLGVAKRTVIVRDTIAPIITLLGNNPLTNVANASFIDPGALSVDACGGIFALTTNSTVLTNIVGSYLIKYISADSSGNAATNTRIVVIVGPPIISTNPTASIIATNSANGTRTIRFNMMVNPQGLATTVQLQFGLTTNYAGNYIFTNVPTDFTYSNLMSELPFSPGSAYHWRIAAINGAGAASSEDQNFSLGSATSGGGIPGDLNNDGIVSQSELNLVYANYVTNSPWLYLTNTLGLGEIAVSFELLNSVAGNYTVEVSTNLVDWTVLGPASPRYGFTDTNSLSNQQRYYRLRYP